MRSGQGDPQQHLSFAACLRAAVGKASSMRRQYTSLFPLSQGSCHRLRSRRVTTAARSPIGVSPGLPLAVSTRPTKSAWRCCRRCCTCSSCAWVAWRTDRASSCTVPCARRAAAPPRGRLTQEEGCGSARYTHHKRGTRKNALEVRAKSCC